MAWVVTLVLLIVGGVGVQHALSQTQSLQARRLDIVDSSGHTRLLLGFDTGGHAGMWIYDEANKGRVFIGFGAVGNVTPQVTLSDENGTGRIYMGWSTQEKPILQVSDQTGKAMWTAP
jgi:hypothetical protein